MPSLGADMEVGVVARWLVAPGDAVHRGDLVATIDTEKATIDAEIFEDGVVETLLVKEGDEVPVGTPLATIVPAPGEARAPARAERRARRARGRPSPPVLTEAPERPGAPEKPGAPEGPPLEPPPPPLEPPPPPLEPPAPAAPPVAPSSAPAERLHSPVVRRLAQSLGVDLSRLEGSGPGGAVTRSDVEAAAGRPPRTGGRRPGRHVRAAPFVRRRARELGVDLSAVHPSGPDGLVTVGDLEAAAGPPTTAGPAPAPAPAPAAPRAGAGRTPSERQAAQQRQVARLMARSKREIPHYYLQATIDLGPVTAFLADANLHRAPAQRLLPAAALVKATALAAREVPEVNGHYTDDEFRPSPAVHLGVAVALREGGLVAPAIHDVDRLSLDEVMAAMADLVARARSGRLRSSEMTDATLTVTSLGDLGVDAVFGVIYPPQVALVGFGAIVERPFAAGGLVGARPVVTATLSGDHRVSDGRRGARFLRALDARLQRVEEL